MQSLLISSSLPFAASEWYYTVQCSLRDGLRHITNGNVETRENHMIKTTHLRGIVLETTQLAAQQSFYSEVWGLSPLPHEQTGRQYFRGRGEEPWVLGLAEGKRDRLVALRLGLANRVDVDRAAQTLSSAGLELRSSPAMLDGPGGYYGLVVQDPDGRSVELSATEEVATGAGLGRPWPIRMSHVVLNSPQARHTVNFYTEMLGFTISDWYEHDAIIFMRCNVDHHCVGIGQGHNAALNHAAFLVDDGAAVTQAGQLAQARGAQPLWGPGRHGPGGNVFSYFRDPLDVVVEYTAELIQVPDEAEWQAKEWARTPKNANVWGTGGPTPLAIELMNGRPL